MMVRFLFHQINTLITPGNIDKWHKSEADADKLGVCEFATPKEVYDKAQDGGIKTTEDAKFYRYAAAFSKPISNKDKEMCVQFSVKHEQNIDCGGGYVKLMGEAFKAAEFTGDTDYEIMFGRFEAFLTRALSLRPRYLRL